jgi:signal transduction histidine kinase
VRVNPDEIGQIVLNLVVNALEAIPPDSEGMIRVRSYQDHGQVVLAVEDTGPGIPASVAKNLFNPFFTTKKSGTGLGLSISQRIAQAHGGNLTFETTPGKGTVFRLSLPTDRSRSVH